MIKQCPVIINNGAVTVIKFGDIDVQLPYCNKKDIKTLNVKFENGQYSIIDDIDETVKEIVEDDVNDIVDEDKSETTAKKKKTRKQSKKKVEANEAE